MPVDKNQGSNTAPAYSWYMYKYRGAFVAPRATCAPCSSIDQMDKASLGKYASQLCLETKECEQNTRNFAFLLKQPGNVVYHPSSVFEPGYCTPSLVVNGPIAFHDLVGATVGDRVKINKINAYPLKPEKKNYPLDSDDSSYEEICSNLARKVLQQRRAEGGVITSLLDDGGSELSV